MNRAFASGGPLTDHSAPKGEQDGTRALFAGAFGALRNPAGRRQVDYDDLSEAAEAVQLASWHTDADIQPGQQTIRSTKTSHH